ncbi:MAG: SRPBCC domain-containing protein, partial [Casimicrobium sp.]
CWPAGVLALGATIVTNEREIAADSFFVSLYSTALNASEIIVAIRIPQPLAARYIKFEQSASRFALVGVAVVRFERSVRIAITGLGNGVTQWREAEDALAQSFSQSTLDALMLDSERATGDLHASAAYRVHLARVLTCRAIAAINNEAPRSLSRVKSAEKIDQNTAINSATDRPMYWGNHFVPENIDKVWNSLIDPIILGKCVPGCKSFTAENDRRYLAIVKVGLGPIAATFQSHVTLYDLQAPHRCRMTFEGDAGALGRGSGTAQIELTVIDGGTRIEWRADAAISGKIAQLGARLFEATAKKLAEEFFANFANTFSTTATVAPPSLSWWRKFWQRLSQR